MGRGVASAHLKGNEMQKEVLRYQDEKHGLRYCHPWCVVGSHLEKAAFTPLPLEEAPLKHTCFFCGVTVDLWNFAPSQYTQRSDTEAIVKGGRTLVSQYMSHLKEIRERWETWQQAVKAGFVEVYETNSYNTWAGEIDAYNEAVRELKIPAGSNAVDVYSKFLCNINEQIYDLHARLESHKHMPYENPDKYQPYEEGKVTALKIIRANIRQILYDGNFQEPAVWFENSQFNHILKNL